MGSDDYVIVYRGFDVTGLDMVESMLRAEGLEPQRLGKAQPALLGVGNAAVEQLIAVAPEHADAAISLIGASQRVPNGQLELAELEAQALSAEPARSPGIRGPNLKLLVLLILGGALLYSLLR